MKKNFMKNWPRKLIQYSVLAYLFFLFFRGLLSDYTPDFEAYCPFGGLQALSSYFVRGSLACTMTTTQIGMGILLLVGVVLFGKLFCAYICPLGTLTEWLSSLGRRFKLQREVPAWLDKVLRSLKYILLFVVFYFTLTSSELFCKNFDPFFAGFTLFDHDVTAWMAILAIVVLIVGSLLYRMFWCKYFCPIAALSTIFKFAFMFIGVMLLYIGLNLLGLNLHFTIPLAILVIAGYLTEVLKMESNKFPLLKIKRIDPPCTSCKLCDKSCPQGIKISETEVVKHVDCNLCGDCLDACNVDGSLAINGKKSWKWMPPIIVIVLIALGLLLADKWEVPTITEHWVDQEQIRDAESYSLSGIKSVKCYGSSMAFARQMSDVRGVLGVETYVGHNRVKVYYNSKILSPEKIKEAIFTPVNQLIKRPSKDETSFKVVELGINNFFDKFDSFYLTELLKQFDQVYGFQTIYGEPVQTKIIFHKDAQIDLKKLKNHLESKFVEYKTKTGELMSAEINFEIVDPQEKGIIGLDEFRKILFVNYFRTFNNRARYSADQIDVFEVKLNYMENQTSKTAFLQNFVSRLDTGIVAINSVYHGDFPVVQLHYVKELTNEENLLKLIMVDSLEVHFKNGGKKIIKNEFKDHLIE